MKKINVKKNTIIWGIIGFVALVIIILGSIIISNVNKILEIKNVSVNEHLIQEYKGWKAYCIGFLAFSSVIFSISSVIVYLGARSWNYSATL